MKIEIRNRFPIESSFNLRGANLRGANLHGANLGEANLYRANLHGANLHGANLYGANLEDADFNGANLEDADLGCADLRRANFCGSNLGRANLREANLREANLRGANLRGVNLRGAFLGDAGKLLGARPYFAIGPIGSRCDYLESFLTETGMFIRAGCFFGTLDEFIVRLNDDHGDNAYAVEYRAALVLINAHYEVWL